MRATLKYALIFAGLSILAKIIMWQTGLLDENTAPSAMFYLGALLVSIFIALNETKSKEQLEPTTYFNDLRVAMQSVAYFTIIITFFTYIYYKFIDWEFMYDRIAERIQAAEELELTADINPHNLTKEEFIESERKISETIFSPSTQATITLMAFMIVGGVYSAILTAVIRMSPKFRKN